MGKRIRRSCRWLKGANIIVHLFSSIPLLITALSLITCKIYYLLSSHLFIAYFDSNHVGKQTVELLTQQDR